ncbi:MAG: YaaA family protein [Flavobacteriales bacterium]|nr:YaaA family protein [Flavobacteriales bacterium]MBT7381948.1 YaaA family protein [Flavobacteriales bacterium]
MPAEMSSDKEIIRGVRLNIGASYSKTLPKFLTDKGKTLTFAGFMIAILSSSKTMQATPVMGTQPPCFIKQAESLANQLKAMDHKAIQAFYQTSDAMTLKVSETLSQWKRSGSGAALFSFKGDAFGQLNPGSLSGKAQIRANEQLIIVSGLYGMLRPMDQISPYRLDMNQRLNDQSLRAYWASIVTQQLDQRLEPGGMVLNLASQEYAQVILRDQLKAHQWVDVQFLQKKDGASRQMSVFSKQARGLMARHLCSIEHADLNHIKAFQADGYRLDRLNSTESQLTFTRKAP